jgi:hypothetical protein
MNDDNNILRRSFEMTSKNKNNSIIIEKTERKETDALYYNIIR